MFKIKNKLYIHSISMNISNISIGNNLKSNDSNLIAEIDKHVEIKFLKEGRRNKTYIYGLEDFIEGGDKELTKYVEKLQKKLGTNLIKEQKDGKKFYAFGGDHVSVIKKFVIDDLKIPTEKIRT